MNYESIKNIVESKRKGTISTITYEKTLKTRKGVTDVITKKTVMQGRTGVRYDNMKAVKEARADGSLPTENQGLSPNLEWIDNNFIKNNKTGAVMLRVAFANGNKTVSEYYRNGKIVDKSEIIPLCLKSETASKGTAPTVFNIGIDKITDIK